MSAFLLQIGATKLALSIVLAGFVWVVQRRVNRPATVHALWPLVLGVLLVPAVVPLRVLPGEVAGEVVAPSSAVPMVVENARLGAHGTPARGWLRESGRPLVAIVWLLGSAGFFGWTLVRTVRFQRTLNRAARPAPTLQRQAAGIADTLGLPRVPRVYTTTARLRPMVWWTGGSVRVLIPSVFVDELDETALRAVLAHELAHVRRRDYLVRVVEWLVCSVFWWNPVVWWARRELRSAEESCCDILAVCGMRSTRDRYAGSLLRVVEVMSAGPVQRTPALASAADVGRDMRQLEKRLKTVLREAPDSDVAGWLRAVGKAALVGGMCMGIVYCDTVERAEGPGTAQQPTGVATDTNPDTQARGPDSFLLAPDTLRNWIVIWSEGSFDRGPGPAAMAADPITNCWLDAEAWNEGERPVWDCLLLAEGDSAVLTEVPVTSVTASDSVWLRGMLGPLGRSRYSIDYGATPADIVWIRGVLRDLDGYGGSIRILEPSLVRRPALPIIRR